MITNVYEALREVSGRLKDEPALKSPNLVDTSFVDLLSRIDDCRSILAGYGVGRNDRVGIVVASRDLMASVHLGVISVTTSAPLDPNAGPRELDSAVADMRLSYLVIEDQLEALLQHSNSLPVRTIKLTRASNAAGHFALEGIAADPATDIESPMPSDISVLLQTSGTTARSKIVPRHAGVAVEHAATGRPRKGPRSRRSDSRCTSSAPH